MNRVKLAHNREMRRRNALARAGFTLVELLVVAAIIAAVLGISISGIVAFGGMGRTDFGGTARELHGALKAAKIYAATYRVNTAVVYVVEEVQDSVANDTIQVITGLAVVRGTADRQDAERLGQAWVNETGSAVIAGEVADYLRGEGDFTDFAPLYIPLFNVEGQFRPLGRDGVVLNAFPKAGQLLEDVDDIGILPLRVVDPNNWTDGADFLVGYPDPIQTHIGVELFGEDEEVAPPTLFPAHVFTPDGTIRMSASVPERVTLEIGPSPALAEQWRFSRDLSEAERSTSMTDEEPQVPLALAEIGAGKRFLIPVEVEIYRSTGRVRLVSKGM